MHKSTGQAPCALCVSLCGRPEWSGLGVGQVTAVQEGHSRAPAKGVSETGVDFDLLKSDKLPVLF